MALCPKRAPSTQPIFRKWTPNIVDQQLFPSALRDLRADLTNRNAIVAMVGVGMVLGMSGPFDTMALLSFGPRVVYWTIVVVLTFVVGSFISTIGNILLHGKPLWMNVVFNAFTVGLSVTVVLIILNSIAFGFLPETRNDLLTHWMYVTAISAVIETGSKLVRPPETVKHPPLLDRLPYAKRGALIALSAQDHYVGVHTARGTEMLLMRMSDAIKEAGPTVGLQIHRSHWVAMDQIANVRRINDRAEVVLSTGETRPISRGYMAAVRDAGLLPRGRNG